MKYYLYRLNPEKPVVDVSDFISLEIAPRIEDVRFELQQDILGDIYARFGVDPNSLQVSGPSAFSSPEFPKTTYRMRADLLRGDKNSSGFQYGICVEE